MFGMIGKMTIKEGGRDTVVSTLLSSAGSMAGCLSYVVATDTTDPNAIWITEVWDSKESHDASLNLAAVQAAIAKARPFIAGMTPVAITAPLGGYGLSPARI